ncbi:hypothetical protein [Pseudoroseomonas cervicalis]|uniref:hypothetical protein n=1 Tax=Teichococcus cervicalis TaxID=204525 RepID=UPI002784710E|nr:hypothetical protein [Pseudoroseomonas cervicalis]MDQ1077992.1 hypothetical protein [Pseudoroseomonas cervicalis]
MSEIVVGSRVRVVDPSCFIRAVETKVKDRVGTVQKVFTPAGSTDVWVRVLFDARRKGSPTYSEAFHIRHLMLAEREAGI